MQDLAKTLHTWLNPIIDANHTISNGNWLKKNKKTPLCDPIKGKLLDGWMDGCLLNNLISTNFLILFISLSLSEDSPGLNQANLQIIG